jgi:hypothetical protein
VVAAKHITELQGAAHEAARRQAAVQQVALRPRQAGMGTEVELSDIDSRARGYHALAFFNRLHWSGSNPSAASVFQSPYKECLQLPLWSRLELVLAAIYARPLLRLAA